MSRTALVFLSGWLGGQTASTVKPAFAKAIANRAVGNQRHVVAIKTIDFTFDVYSTLECGIAARTIGHTTSALEDAPLDTTTSGASTQRFGVEYTLATGKGPAT